jgi:hypothetical protein
VSRVAVDELGLERVEEALGHCTVVAVTLGAHAGAKSVAREQHLVVVRPMLAAASFCSSSFQRKHSERARIKRPEPAPGFARGSAYLNPGFQRLVSAATLLECLHVLRRQVVAPAK